MPVQLSSGVAQVVERQPFGLEQRQQLLGGDRGGAVSMMCDEEKTTSPGVKMISPP